MIDSHCHLDLIPDAISTRDVLQAAAKAGVSRILAPSISETSWQRLLNMSDAFHQLLPIDVAVGFHPYFLDSKLSHSQIVDAMLNRLIDAACSGHSAIKAVGETGLDSHIKVPMALQQAVLSVHLTTASKYDLPIILHHRKSHHLLFEALKKITPDRGGVIHAFSGSVDVSLRYIERGFLLGFGGTITYARANKTRDTLRYLAEHHLDKIVLETDAPDMPMNGRQGVPNSPEFLPDVVDTIEALTGISKGTIIKQTSENYQRLFD
tara:strand:- start:15 stop:809 length:795 start_codon:yes stop_codon:yes gene_type:complete